jgi:hypothetical protein
MSIHVSWMDNLSEQHHTETSFYFLIKGPHLTQSTHKHTKHIHTQHTHTHTRMFTYLRHGLRRLLSSIHLSILIPICLAIFKPRLPACWWARNGRGRPEVRHA